MSIQRIETARGHRYEIDGKPADGVTTLISKGLPKPALTYWAAKSVAEHVADNLDQIDMWGKLRRDSLVAELKGVPWAKRDAAAAKGTEVHTLAEKLSNGEKVDVPEHLSGYVDACIMFLDEWEVQPLITEVIVASRQWNYCGSGDGIADFRDGIRRLYDYKTSQSGIFGETSLQLSGYAHSEVYLHPNGTEKPTSDLGIQAGMGVWLRADGRYEVYEMDISEPVFKTFLHVAYVARQMDAIKGWKSQALYAPVVNA